MIHTTLSQNFFYLNLISFQETNTQLSDYILLLTIDFKFFQHTKKKVAL